MNYVYLVRCTDDTLYCGWTTDLQARLKAHNCGRGARYTRSRLPVELVYFEEYEDKGEALSREWHVKRMTRKEKLKLIYQKEAGAMKEKINITEYANLITETLPKGILLNTNNGRFNSMVIGWGHLGTLWGLPTFVVYVRQSRYTKAQLDQSGEFTISVPLEGIIPSINRICGAKSGRDTDKAAEAGLTLVDAETIHTPGIKEYPLTLECRILYAQDQDLMKIPEDIRERMYPQDVPGTHPMANRDFHTMYVGQIVDAYIIR